MWSAAPLRPLHLGVFKSLLAGGIWASLPHPGVPAPAWWGVTLTAVVVLPILLVVVDRRLLAYEVATYGYVESLRGRWRSVLATLAAPAAVLALGLWLLPASWEDRELLVMTLAIGSLLAGDWYRYRGLTPVFAPAFVVLLGLGAAGVGFPDGNDSPQAWVPAAVAGGMAVAGGLLDHWVLRAAAATAEVLNDEEDAEKLPHA